jgi:hypothetical protein
MSVKKAGWFGSWAGVKPNSVRQFLYAAASVAAMTPLLYGCVMSPMTSKTPSLVDTPRLEVTPSSINFSSAITGVQSSQSLKLSNTGEEALTVTGVIASGPGLSISGFAGSTLLNPGTSGALTVQFTPSASGAFSGSVSVVTNTAVTASLPVTGEVSAAKLAISVGPTSVSFGTVAAGKSVTQAVTLTNTGNSDVTISQISVSGTAFSMAGGNAPVKLEASQSAAVDVKFDPTAAGNYTGALKVASNASEASVSVPLSGAVAATSSAAHSVELSWDASASKISGYNVYRGGASAGPFARLNGSLVSGLNFTDETVAGGATYYYVTTAVNSEGVESNHSNTAVAVVP